MSLAETKHTERTYDPGGGLWEHLDPSRSEVVKLCGEKGVTLFTFLLESSTILPDRQMANVSLGCLRDVALALHASPDTVKRYVAVFRAINLVHHSHDRGRLVRLQIPLGAYPPLTNFTALDALLGGSRQKQRQLALKVKTRYMTRFGDPTATYADSIHTTFHELSAILEGEHLAPLKRERLQMKIADLLTQLIGKEVSREGDLNTFLDDLETVPSRRASAVHKGVGDSNQELESVRRRALPGQGNGLLQVGDSNPPMGDTIPQHTVSSRQQTTQAGDSNPQLGDLTTPLSLAFRHQSGGQGDLNRQTGDFTSRDALPSWQQIHREGDSNPHLGDPTTVRSLADLHQSKKLGDLNQTMGDFILQQSVHPPRIDESLGDSNGQAAPRGGDSNQVVAAEIPVNAPYTYNVIYLIKNIMGDNVIRKRLAQFLASVLEKREYENGYPTFSKYLKAFKCYSPEVIGRAFLATLVLLHRKHWRVEKPGATFTDQCRILSGQMPLAYYTLDEVEEWLAAWGNVPYAELITVLAAPSPEPAEPVPAPLVAPSNRVAATSATGGVHSNGLPGSFGAGGIAKKKRTYGLQYTGLPTAHKDFHTLGSPRPPDAQKKS